MKKIFTKIIVLLAFFSLSFKGLKAQYVTIPDANFAAWLNNYYPNCMIGNQMDTTCSEVVNMFGVYLISEGVSDLTGIQYLDSLKELKINFNPITSLPNLPKTLVKLDCASNDLASLPALPNTLVTLNCNGNQLTSLPTLPDSLSYLYCNSNTLNGLPSLPNSLLELNCSGVNLSALNSLPINLIEFICVSCQITTLPALPNSLEYLSCGSNSLTSLPNLPNSLSLLHCNNNQLISLPNLPNSLVNIWCNNNQLINLPTLPNQLTHLSCSYNQLTSLPEIPNTILLFVIDSNNINCLPLLPDKNYNSFSISGNQITCVPNYINAMDSATLALPLCQDNDIVNNPNGCSSTAGISGHTYFDLNQNCLHDNNEQGVSNVKINFFNIVTNQFGASYSDLSGVFDFSCLTGTYYTLVDTLNKPYSPNCLHPGIDSVAVTSSLNPFIQNVNFDIACKPGIDLGIQSILEINGVAFPGQQHTLQVMIGDASQWYGLNCGNGSSGQVQITVTGLVNYNGPATGALTPIVNGNVYTYNIADFGSINNSTDFQLLFTTDTSAQAGDQICVHVEVTPILGDINTANNIKDYCYNVVNSYDPNYKEVYPTNVPPLFQDWLTYTIHFQNLGTAPAINIRLLDTLDSNLDAETFEVINYSHYNTVTLMDGIIDFRFPNILLPDSASYPNGSQGFVQYRVKPKANLSAGTQIENTAHIYFDYNPAVVTNTTVNNFTTTVGNKSLPQASRLWLYPNPSTGVFTISAKANIEVYNIVGDLILSENNATSIDLTDASKGMYFVRLNGGKIEKLMKN